MSDAMIASSLYETCRTLCPVGAAVTPRMLADPAYSALIRRHFNSLTAENIMKPMFVLDREATLASGDPHRAAVRFGLQDRMLAWARDNGIRVRFHTLVWHNQTPRWFFAENWSDAPDAPVVSAEVMLARQAAYIADVMEHVNTAFPGLVYAWDVVNEAVEPDHGREDCLRTKSLWFQTTGGDFIAAAFREARKHQAPTQYLIYNDFSTFVPMKRKALISLLSWLKDENLVDGIGMQGHLDLDRFDAALFETSARAFAELGLTLQITELDIHCRSDDSEAQAALARDYAAVFDILLRLKREGADISGVTFWGVTDSDTWLRGFRRVDSYPLLFSGDMRTKPAFDAVLETVQASGSR